ncbi:MAG: tRNA adenosine(34) deaminase TadA [Myxococcota bacterium]
MSRDDAPVMSYDAWMQEALCEAETAAHLGEVPVGAVIVLDGAIVARAHNLREAAHDPLAHAEILAIREAAHKLGRWRLTGCTLVVTLEPCPMCAGAVVNARLDRLVYGATDPRAGACGTIMDVVRDPRLNHRAEVVSGVLAESCGTVLREFFSIRRKALPSRASPSADLAGRAAPEPSEGPREAGEPEGEDR